MNKIFFDLTKDFANRKYLSKKVDIEFRIDADRPRLYCDNPAIVARYVGQIRQEAVKKWGTSTPVLVRGQVENSPRMEPSIFHPPYSNVDYALLIKAESKLIDDVRDTLSNYARFKRKYLSALLQHYGFRTTWLDLVDNLWVATWFASNRIILYKENIRKIEPSNNKTGWIYIISPNVEQKNTQCIDLRETHHSLSLRPQTQHGWSLKGPKGKEKCLDKYIIGTVEFPITSQWKLSGNLWRSNYLFPSRLLDDTYRRLEDQKVNELARKIEGKIGIPDGALGNLYSVTNKV